MPYYRVNWNTNQTAFMRSLNQDEYDGSWFFKAENPETARDYTLRAPGITTVHSVEEVPADDQNITFQNGRYVLDLSYRAKVESRLNKATQVLCYILIAIVGAWAVNVLQTKPLDAWKQYGIILLIIVGVLSVLHQTYLHRR